MLIMTVTQGQGQATYLQEVSCNYCVQDVLTVSSVHNQESFQLQR